MRSFKFCRIVRIVRTQMFFLAIGFLEMLLMGGSKGTRAAGI